MIVIRQMHSNVEQTSADYLLEAIAKLLINVPITRKS